MNTRYYPFIIIGAVLLVVAIIYIFKPKETRANNEAEMQRLEQRNKYLESQQYKDSLYRVDTVLNTITLTNERIIYNTKIYEKIIHKYDSAPAAEHERYYRARYGEDSAKH